jgi:hypothetical protein
MKGLRAARTLEPYLVDGLLKSNCGGAKPRPRLGADQAAHTAPSRSRNHSRRPYQHPVGLRTDQPHPAANLTESPIRAASVIVSLAHAISVARLARGSPDSLELLVRHQRAPPEIDGLPCRPRTSPCEDMDHASTKPSLEFTTSGRGRLLLFCVGSSVMAGSRAQGGSAMTRQTTQRHRAAAQPVTRRSPVSGIAGLGYPVR